MIVADASPLIVLAKLRRLRLLHDLYGDVLIGPVVKAETLDAGRVVRAQGVEALEAAVEDGRMQMVHLMAAENARMKRLMSRSRLGPGEAESIALAGVRGLRLIVDDKEARGVAAVEGVEHVGTAGVFLDAYRRGRLDLGELENTLRDLGRILWLSPVVVAEVLRLAREAEQ